MTGKEIFLYIITVLLSGFSFIITLNTNLFGLIAQPDLNPVASIGISIIIFLIGDRIASNIAIAKLEAKIPQVIKSSLNIIPQVNVIVEFSSSDSAMDYLCSRLENAKLIWNTKISKDTIPPKRRVQNKYTEALSRALKSGNLVYKDLVSSGFEQYSIDLKNSSDGAYDYRVANVETNSFLNFILLTDENDDEELIIGWATSTLKGTEQKAYKIRDRRMISYFREYFQALFS